MATTDNCTFTQAINDGLRTAMTLDERVITYGLGVTDPKGVFGTTVDLEQCFGSERVFDMPTSENAMTGVAIGAALNGLIPVMCHQRLDFFLLALDQLVNNAAKWRFMFGGHRSVPITIRLIVGMGWGQGPTHSQSLQSWFAHIPGIKVVCPTNPHDAKGLLLSSIFDPDPVLVIEHRWLHSQVGKIPSGDIRTPIGEAAILRKGNAVTIVTYSHMVVEAIKACDVLAAQGIDCDLIDLRTLSPIDWATIDSSVMRTGRLLAVDSSHAPCSIASEMIAHCAMAHHGAFMRRHDG